MVTASLFTGVLTAPRVGGFPARKVICSGTVTVAEDAKPSSVCTPAPDGLALSAGPALGRHAGNGGRRWTLPGSDQRGYQGLPIGGVALRADEREQRLTLMPSLTNLPSSGWSGAGTLAWCRATSSHWSLKTGEPDDPGWVSAS